MSRVRAKAYGGQPSLQDMDTIVADISVGGYSDVEFSSFILRHTASTSLYGPRLDLAIGHGLPLSWPCPRSRAAQSLLTSTSASSVVPTRCRRAMRMRLRGCPDARRVA